MYRFLTSAFFLSFTFIFCEVHAQSHTFAKPNSACRFSKDKRVARGGGRNNLEGFVICAACDAEDKKETIAKAKEDKRLADIAIEKNRLERIAKVARDKKQAEEDKKKNQVTAVYVTAPKVTATTPPKAKTAPIVVKANEKNYFYTEHKEIFNRKIMDMYWPDKNQNFKTSNFFIVNNKKIFTNNEFKVCVNNVWRDSDPKEYNFPPNVGLVVLNETYIDTYGKQLQISDLVDINGKRILNDNSISVIIHFADDYFIAFKGEPSSSWGYNYINFSRNNGDAFIYNVKTKQKHIVRRFLSDEGKDLGYEVDYIVGLRGGPTDIDPTKYKTRFRSKVSFSHSMSYYVTLDGKIEEKLVKL